MVEFDSDQGTDEGDKSSENEYSRSGSNYSDVSHSVLRQTAGIK